jgi:uncharacterized membrane protein YkvA (DUF1232 family)
MWKRLTVIWAALRGDLKLLWLALRHPESPGWLKVGTALLVLYLFMPIDLLPDVIPFVGAIDDVLIITFGVKWLLGKLPKDLMDKLRGKVVDAA